MSERELKTDLDALKEEMSRLRDDFVDLAHVLKDVTRSGVEAARERLDGGTHGLLDELRSVLDRLRTRGKEAVGSVEAKVEKNPLVSVMVAFGIGLVAGKLLERR
jgi:ElaB/YqjD/DUF883 family membrane-anchored ribosome-binding protein